MSTKNPGLIPYQFQDTGRTILIRKVSPYLVFELSKAFPAPKPIQQEVDYGDGKKRMEENPAHPDYLEAMRNYNRNFQERLTTLMIKRGVEIELTDEIKAEVAELRAFWREEYKAELDPSDKMVYILNLCVGSDKDLEELIEKITRRSQPTEAVVAEALDGFRS